MNKETKLMIGLGIGIALLIGFISSCTIISNKKENKILVKSQNEKILKENIKIEKCRKISKTLHPDNQILQEEELKLQIEMYEMIEKFPDSEFKTAIENIFYDNYLTQMNHLLLYGEDYNEMINLPDSEFKTLIDNSYPSILKRVLFYHDQMESKEFIEGIRQSFKLIVRHEFPNNYCLQEKYYKTEWLEMAERMEKEGYLND